MQGYLKYKEVDEELYEIKFEFVRTEKKSIKNICIIVSEFIIRMYLNFVVLLKKMFNIITVKEIYSGLIFILPFKKQENKNIDMLGKLRMKKCLAKVKGLMKKYNVETLILPNDLKENKDCITYFKNCILIDKKVNILDETELNRYLIKEIIEYILKEKNRSIELEDLYILVKKDDIKYREIIIYLSQYFKTINIVTPEIKLYQRFSNTVDSMITVTNNKKKSLRKSKWIVNFDMSSKELNKYTISRNATIINLKKEEGYENSLFSGIHICKAGIDISSELKKSFEKEHLLNQYSITVLYLSTIRKNKSFIDIKEKMKKDKIKITKLYGRRGILNDEEFKRVV